MPPSSINQFRLNVVGKALISLNCNKFVANDNRPAPRSSLDSSCGLVTSFKYELLANAAKRPVCHHNLSASPKILHSSILCPSYLNR